MLTEDETQKIKRQDYCTACWSQFNADQKLPANKGYWKSKIEIKKKPAPASRPERALILLKNLLESTPAPEEEIFVLILFLCHTRHIVLRKELVEDNIRYGLYEILNQDEFLKIKQINLSNLETERIQQSLAAKLKS